jgi:hypothetical protein
MRFGKSLRRPLPPLDKEDRMAFTLMLEKEDGTPADPPVLHTAVPSWQTRFR